MFSEAAEARFRDIPDLSKGDHRTNQSTSKQNVTPKNVMHKYEYKFIKIYLKQFLSCLNYVESEIKA